MKCNLSLLRGDYVKNNYSKRAIARLRYALNKENKKRMSMTYYERNFKNVLYRMRSNYALSSPNNETKQYYHDKIMEFIVNYPDIVEKLISSINVNDNEDQSYDVKCRVATSILLESVLKNRIHKIGLLISTVNSVRKYQLKDESDFGERYHTQYIVSHITMTQHIYCQMIVTKLIKQYPLMLMANVTLLHLIQQNQTKMTMTMSIKMSNSRQTKT